MRSCVCGVLLRTPAERCEPCAAREASQSLEPSGPWAKKAACSGRAETMFDPSRVASALMVCERCPSLSPCAEWSLTVEVFGVAGGMTSAEREAERLRRFRVAS